MDHNAQNLAGGVKFVRDQNETFKLLNQPWQLPNFRPNQQTRKHLRNLGPRLLLTVVFLVSYAVTLRSHQVKQPLARREKNQLDVITTGLILALGLNFFEVFKDTARILRWRILSRWSFNVREVDLILGAESLMKMLQLMTISFRKPSILFSCLLWLTINIGAQVSVGVLPLFALTTGGHNSKGVTISQDYVSVPKLDCFYHSGTTKCAGADQFRLDPAVAHTYGESGIFRDKNCIYRSSDDIKNGPQTCPYFVHHDRREFAVRYADLNPADLTSAYPYYGADRTVNTTATNCNAYRPPKPPIAVDSTDGIGSDYVWQFENRTGTYSLSIPRTSLAYYSTTYVWNDTKLPFDGTSQSCGERCVVLYALRDNGNGDIVIFQCDITVSPVSKIKNPAHELSDSMARTAAASIAFTGRWRSPSKGSLDWRQSQLYQDGTDWAARVDDSAEDVGALMAEFAAAALATMARRNPTTRIPGDLPTLGYQVEVDWKAVLGLASGIGVVHLLFMLLTVWLARPVIVIDDSYLAMTPLLRGLVGPLPEEEEKELRTVTTGGASGRGDAPVEESRPLVARSPLSARGTWM